MWCSLLFHLSNTIQLIEIVMDISFNSLLIVDVNICFMLFYQIGLNDSLFYFRMLIHEWELMMRFYTSNVHDSSFSIEKEWYHSNLEWYSILFHWILSQNVATYHSYRFVIDEFISIHIEISCSLHILYLLLFYQ